jgi:hypothetical protein
VLNIPDWALGVGVICIACFVGIALMVRLLPESLRRAKKRPTDEGERLAELDRRVGELEAGRHRVAELEERLDFAERLLARQRDAQRVGPPKT